MTPAPIPEWFKEKMWKASIDRASHLDSEYREQAEEDFDDGAEWAYRLLSAQGLRWVKVSEQNPDKTGRYYVKYSGDISGEQREGLFYFNVNWSAGPYKVEYWLLDESPAPIQ